MVLEETLQVWVQPFHSSPSVRVLLGTVDMHDPLLHLQHIANRLLKIHLEGVALSRWGVNGVFCCKEREQVSIHRKVDKVELQRLFILYVTHFDKEICLRCMIKKKQKSISLKAPNDAQFACLGCTRSEIHLLQVWPVCGGDPLNLLVKSVFTL